jgi:hypothetical protein
MVSPPTTRSPSAILILAFLGQIDLHARAELDQADAFAALHRVVLRDERHDAPRDQAGDEAHADFFAARLDGFDADQTFSLNFALSARMALRYWPGECLKKAMRPVTGAFWTWTLNTERKMEMRWHSPPMNSGLGVESIVSTLPWPGAMTRLGAAGGGPPGRGKNKR